MIYSDALCVSFLLLRVSVLLIHLSFYTCTHTYNGNYKNAIHAVIVHRYRSVNSQCSDVRCSAGCAAASGIEGRRTAQTKRPRAFKHTRTHARAHTRGKLKSYNTGGRRNARTRRSRGSAARKKWNCMSSRGERGLRPPPGCLQEEGREIRVNFTLRHTE